MTKDEIISIAKKFGLATWHNDMKRWTLEIGLEQFTSEIEAFAAAKARQPLTEEQIKAAVRHLYGSDAVAAMVVTGDIETARAIKSAHGITVGQQ